MAQRVASLYAEIGADTSGLKRGLADTKGQLKDTAKGFSDFTGNLIKGFGYVTGAIVATKKVLDFGKEGAQLAYIEERFDRLSMSIGVTSDKLMRDLRNATRGTRSDMELAASAADLMALGLAKNYDEVLRLTRVAGALNMDMNQLVLTLTNQTTARFDQLGVSVDGFKEKVAALKEEGYDANAAFKEAFLRQAEDQVNKVGDAADSTAGDFARMDAATKNAGDAIKKWLAPAVANAADAIYYLLEGTKLIDDAFNEHKEVVFETSTNYKDYRTEMERSIMEAGKLADTKRGLTLVIDEEGNEIYKVNNALELMTEAQYLAAKAAESGISKAREYANAQREVATAGAEGSGALDAWQRSARAAARETEYLVDKQKELDAQNFRDVLDVLDRDVGSPIKSFIEDLQWFQAGGWRINVAFEELKRGLEEGRITPAQAEQWAGELFAATQDLQVDLNNVTAQEAARNIQETLGGSLQDARDRITSTDGIQGALERLTSTEWVIHVRIDYNQPSFDFPNAQGSPYVPAPGAPPPPRAPDPPPPPPRPDDNRDFAPTINVFPTKGMDEIDVASVVVQQLMDLDEAQRGGAFAGIGYAG